MWAKMKHTSSSTYTMDTYEHSEKEACYTENLEQNRNSNICWMNEIPSKKFPKMITPH